MNLDRVGWERLPVAWYWVQEVLRKSIKSGTMDALGGDETVAGAPSDVLPPFTLACTRGPRPITFLEVGVFRLSHKNQVDLSQAVRNEVGAHQCN